MIIEAFGQAQAFIDSAIISQVPVQVVHTPTDAKIRTTQIPASVIHLPSDAKVRLSTDPVQVVHLPSDAKVRFTQLSVQVIYQSIPQVYGQAQALIHRHEGYGQAQAHIIAKVPTFAQAQAKINAFDVNRFAQANAAIKPRNGILRRSNTGIYDAFNSPGLPNHPDFYNFTGTWGISAAFVADETGTWSFRVYVDFSGQFYINNTLLTNTSWNSPVTTATISLVAGQVYTFHMDYFGDSLPNILQVWYKRPSDTEFYSLTDNQPPWIQEFTSIKFAQAQATIKAFDQNRFGQAQAKLRSFDYPRHGQANALILRDDEIAFDTSSVGSGSGVVSWTHTPVGVPRGIVLSGVTPNALHAITAVTYGGVNLSLVREAQRGAGAQSTSAIWFLGTNIPTGPQTVSVTSSQSGRFVALSFTAPTDIEVLDDDGGSGASGASFLLSYSGRAGLAVVTTGNNIGASALPGEVLVDTGGIFNGTAYTFRQLFPDTYDFTAGFSPSGSHSYSAVVAAFAKKDTGTRLVYAQAQAKINAFGVSGIGQALAYIGHFQFAQAAARIKGINVPAHGQALAYIGHFGVGLAQARLITFDVEGFGQAAAQIVKSAGYGNALATIHAIVSSVGQAKAWILPTTDVAQAQASIKQTYPLMSLDVNYALTSMGTTATDSIEQPIEPYYAIDGNDYGQRWTIAGIAQDQYLEIDFGQSRTINYYRILPVTYDATVIIQIKHPILFGFEWLTILTVPQFNVNVFADVDTSRVEAGEFEPYTTEAVRIVVIDDGSNNGISLSTVELGWATVKSGTFAQAQAMLGRFGVSQAQAYISPGFGIAHGQAKAQIMETFTRRGQSNAFIIKPQVYGQALASILQTYYAFGQVPSWVIPPTVIANAQATIKAYDVEGFGQAQANIEQTYFRRGQAKAMIHKVGGFGQAQAQIRSRPKRGFGQARAKIGNIHTAQARAWIIKGQGYGQAKAQIKITTQRYGQARAVIFKPFGHAQALARTKQVYRVHGLAVAIMNQTFALAQVNVNIEQTYNAFAQANCRLKNIATNYSKPYGLAQAMIKYRRYTHGQAQAHIAVRHNSVGNAQAFIRSIKIGQAQAFIFSYDYPRTGQAQGYILPSTVVTPPGGPTSEAHTYLVRYNNYDLPGYAQSESYDSVVRIVTNYAKAMDGGLSEYTGLQNKSITLIMKAWEPTYADVKNKVRLASTFLRTAKGFAKLYIQQPDAYFLAMVRSIQTAKTVGESTRVLEYEVEFEAKPWLISNDTYEISGIGAISTVNRTLYDGGWTPTRIIVSGTDIEITATTATGDPAGHIEIDGTVTDLVIDSDNFTATENGLNRNDTVLTKDYAIYVGPGTTNFQINGATSCVIQWNNRWYLSSAKGVSTQPIATTPLPTKLTLINSGLAAASITSGIKQVIGFARAVVNEPIKRKVAQAQALIHSPITNAHGQARALLRNGRVWTHAQAQARIRVIGNEGVGQSRAFIEGNTKSKSAQSRATIRAHRQVKQGQARAKIITLPPAPSGLTATAGDQQATITWS